MENIFWRRARRQPHHDVVDCLRNIAALGATLLPLLASAGGTAEPPIGECPQIRLTERAPDEFHDLQNPLPNADLKTARRLYLGQEKNFGCAACHGKKGDGKGELASSFVPRPRNFTCAETLGETTDGQLFWIIRFGSPGTSMSAHADFSDQQIWQLVAYLRKFSK